MITIQDLKPGQLFQYYNVTESLFNQCEFIGVSLTKTGRKSYNYKFKGKLCKGKATDRVIVISH